MSQLTMAPAALQAPPDEALGGEPPGGDSTGAEATPVSRGARESGPS